ncbi:MAG TPA: hypothetical protein DCG04_12405 [Rhodospirillaceae bacterium]|nr:hypothetical protein [Rhodospirillaceae bacterium]MAX62704.1 hypothetical protein [Rhodospirillaceae bacterium]MBB57517.1 hypothetical protein [Rhodospirillaceae bacterium]HAE02226.1 hypothetical protein [Rhodospirillaceae bacterium]|tara:strand:+ start:118809 stop:119912 length:1104 start_codon:yes stop_codon:yes gene_type:complete
MRKLAIVLLTTFTFCGPVHADTQAPVPTDALKKSVAMAVDQFVIPAYEQFKEAAQVQNDTYARLCAAPSEEGLVAVQNSFAEVVKTFSRIEAFRFGPARDDNRFERLLFWPDPRGRGLQQVQALLLEQDESATRLDTLQQKSVAVQGLLALDFVLFGTGYEAQTTPEGAFRCRYGATMAQSVQQLSNALYDGWQKPGGYGDLMKSAGPDDVRYKTTGEAMQEFLRAAREQLQILRDTKLMPPLQESLDTAKPKLAPFWRSDLTLLSIISNVEGVADLIDSWSLENALPADRRYLAEQLALELNTARDALQQTEMSADRTFEGHLSTQEDYDRLTYASLPLTGAIKLLTSDVPAALGLIAGFNAMDGD